MLYLLLEFREAKKSKNDEKCLSLDLKFSKKTKKKKNTNNTRASSILEYRKYIYFCMFNVIRVLYFTESHYHKHPCITSHAQVWYRVTNSK